MTTLWNRLLVACARRVLAPQGLHVWAHGGRLWVSSEPPKLES